MNSFWLLLFFFLLLSPSSSAPSSPATNVTLSGDAHFTNNSITLTQELNCISSHSNFPPPFGIGRAFYVLPIRFLDSSTNATASFSCRFSFQIIPSSFCPFGDGLAFFITSDPDSVGLSGGSMGLPEQDSYLAVEFDTSFNPSLGDINDNHVGIDVNTVESLYSIDLFQKGISLKSGKQITAWIEYIDSEKVIRVWLGYSKLKPRTPLLVAPIDLSNHFEEFMHIGFSASNRGGSAIHLVEGWRFKAYGLVPSVMSMETVEAGDCVVCLPEDSVDEKGEFNHMDKRVSELALGLGCLAAFIISVSTIVVIIIFWMMRRKGIDSQVCGFQGYKVPKRLSLSEIKSATKGFNQKRIIGAGGAATVYEGSLPSCGAVAVKRFSRVNRIGPFGNQFTTEFATMVGCLRHKNLVQLQGWCCEGNELVLVYEFMANGSLDKILHDKENPLITFLIWERRLDIILGVASALVYLHEECERQIIHRDVKTCNIMLDAEFNAKLGDFGLAEVYEHSCSTREATIPAGTIGYLAPEYVYLGIPTVKTDVYSFGVVVLEVASGKNPVDSDGTLLADWAWGLWERGRLIEAADSKLKGKFNRLEMERMLRVGLLCVHPNSEKRPTVKEAARTLKGEVAVPILPARKPLVSIQSVLPEGSAEIMNCGGDENPYLDETPWLTPKTHFW
ncbi:L-type lectin-domain containing receptor kinase S.6 [Diospyros lotus]|uniref:L-type lectin-domain containing receptor kinase S.6 n=1 Tax=Diospyros lotus TaxID=55363 RepID=UPI0022542145|nr:L-type lectin-domain containing receptor kinase S.6 [Diospyros lotus]